MDIKIWDNDEKQWLKPIEIRFDINGDISHVYGYLEGEDPCKDGYFEFFGSYLSNVAIYGNIVLNPELLPNS